MGDAVSSSHIVSAAPSSSGEGHLTLCPCSSVQSHRRETVLHELLKHESFSWAAVLQEQAAPAWVPEGSQALPANLLQCRLLSPWGHRSCQDPAPARVSHGVTASFRHPPALAWGLPWAAGGDRLHCGPPCAAGAQPASPWSSPGLQGKLCSSTWSTSSLSFTDLGICRVVTPLSSSKNALMQFFFSLLKYITPEVLPSSLMDLVLASSGSSFELAGTGSIGHRGSFWQLLTETICVAPC